MRLIPTWLSNISNCRWLKVKSGSGKVNLNKSERNLYWLVVSTLLKNISKIGSFTQVGVNKKIETTNQYIIGGEKLPRRLFITMHAPYHIGVTNSSDPHNFFGV